ncbi:hypothetical protein GGX14DRAFT_677825 [Mycena pura]|uniref:Secreted protein n=1 Tax=Mycena pura TaxID=153505 RepID=A0AAD6V1I4_9AGAR|nr:hypothetical protein GGX14DRAFT_677825 [Mycena pura]
MVSFVRSSALLSAILYAIAVSRSEAYYASTFPDTIVIDNVGALVNKPGLGDLPGPPLLPIDIGLVRPTPTNTEDTIDNACKWVKKPGFEHQVGIVWSAREWTWHCPPSVPTLPWATPLVLALHTAVAQFTVQC